MYFLLLCILYPVSLLPLRLLYGLSELAFFLIYHVTGYRKEIVRDNLKHAFPEKSDPELFKIRKAFYRNFCDQWIETLKLLSISREELHRRMPANWEVFEELYKEKKNAYVLLGHTFNWEWANLICAWNVQQQFAGVYLPLTSKPFDRFMLRLRSRSGAWLISMKALKRGLVQLKGKQYILAQIADQNPSVTEVATWLPFMHREAPFFRGAEQMARRANAAVVFAGIIKVKRGYYQINLHRFCDDASAAEEGSVLKNYVSFMEQQIRMQPENWMWTHRRWKYTKQ
ncbi:MAG TPA: lysophospholipid acyltransferase family protein [Flavipsychrobacter sp.]|nr:lysophospholipid acyltransferase family protein [Flavipsychrobacter sp.]